MLTSTAHGGVSQVIDIIAIKLKVIEAACGITALSELDLLHRLEKLYLEGIEEGVKIAKDHVQKVRADSIPGQS